MWTHHPEENSNRAKTRNKVGNLLVKINRLSTVDLFISLVWGWLGVSGHQEGMVILNTVTEEICSMRRRPGAVTCGWACVPCFQQPESKTKNTFLFAKKAIQKEFSVCIITYSKSAQVYWVPTTYQVVSLVFLNNILWKLQWVLRYT